MTTPQNTRTSPQEAPMPLLGPYAPPRETCRLRYVDELPAGLTITPVGAELLLRVRQMVNPASDVPAPSCCNLEGAPHPLLARFVHAGDVRCGRGMKIDENGITGPHTMLVLDDLVAVMSEGPMTYDQLPLDVRTFMDAVAGREIHESWSE